MKYAVLAVLLAVMQGAPPVPRQASNDAAQTPANVKAKSKPNQAQPAPAPASGKANSNGPTESDSSKQHPRDTDHSVVIRELPTVTVNSPRRDWVDWGGWLFNLLLVGVGAFQVLLLCWTLRVIRVQAREMQRQRGWMRRQWVEMSQQTASLKEYVDETKKIAKSTVDSAAAANASVALVIDKERARLKITLINDFIFPADKIIFVHYKISFYGSTPAFVTDFRIGLDLTASREAPSAPSWDMPMPIPAVITEQVQIESKSIVTKVFTNAESDAISRRENFVHVRGHLRYKDVFDKERHTNFGKVWVVTDNMNLDGTKLSFWMNCGEPEANEET
jgi:hypothetical protein